MEAVLGVKTAAQIAREYSVHPVQVSQWKAVIRDRLPELFEAGGKAGESGQRMGWAERAARECGRAISRVLLRAREATQRSEKFIRWLRGALQRRLAG